MSADDPGDQPQARPGPAEAAPVPAPVPAPAPAPGPQHARARLEVRARRLQFRAWRRGCPFWGGLLLILGGLELLAIPLSGVLLRGAVRLVIYIGIGGAFGVLIGALLLVAGIMTWLNPLHKTFYSIAGVVLGIISFPASNLGGLFLGMLLAIVGGAASFAWTPVEPAVTEPSGGAAVP